MSQALQEFFQKKTNNSSGVSTDAFNSGLKQFQRASIQNSVTVSSDVVEKPTAKKVVTLDVFESGLKTYQGSAARDQKWKSFLADERTTNDPYDISEHTTSTSFDAEITKLQQQIDWYTKRIDDYNMRGVGITGPADTNNENKPLTTAETKFIDDLGAKLKELEYQIKFLEDAKKAQAASEKINQKYGYVKDRSDFTEKSKYDNSKDNGYYRAANTKSPSGANANSREKYVAMMTDDETQIYNYLFNTKQFDLADEFVDDILPILNLRYEGHLANFAQSMPAGVASVVSIATKAVDPLTLPNKFIGLVTGGYKKYGADYDSSAYITSVARQTEGQRFDKWFGTKESGIAGTIYSGVMSLVDMGVSIGVAGVAGKMMGMASSTINTAKAAQNVTQILMSSQAASQSMMDARQRGLSGIQIAAVGAGSAAAEWLTEKYALDELFDVPPKLWRTVLSEGVSEGASNVLNTAWDLAVSGDKAAMKLQVGELMADGKSYEDAVQTVVTDKLSEIGVESLIGAFSGGIAGGIAIGINNATSVRYSVPSKYAGSDTEAIQWSADAFKKQKNTVAVKGLGTVSIDTATATNAIENAKTPDQALALVALNKSLRLGKAVTADGADTARIVTPVQLNGKAHILTAYATKNTNGDYTVSDVLLDGDVIYNGAAKTGESVSKAKYSIKKDVDGGKFVDIQEDIYADTDGRTVASVIAEIISTRFQNLVNANGQDIQINSKTNREWRKSKSARELIENNAEAYNDKLKTIANANEILTAAKEWIGERLNHERKDDIVEFARGNVSYRVGDNGYVADIIVGIRKNGTAVLYDLVNIANKKITEASVSMASQSPQSRQNASVIGQGNNPATGKIVSQDNPSVNNQSMQNAEEYVAGLHEYGMIGMEPSALDQQFTAMDEQAKADFIARMERATGTKIVFDENMDAQGRYKDGVITINPKTSTPMLVLKHELTHFIEKSGSYGELTRTIMKSQSFSDWLGGKTLGDLRTEKINLYAENGVRLEPYEANQEIFADFIAERVLRDMNAMTELAEHRGFFQKLKNWFMGIVRHFTDSPQEKELRQIEKLFNKAIQEQANSGSSKANKDGKFSFQGYAENGRGKYQSNFPKGTPKSAKSERILHYIQNVWSKKPIRLKINDGGIERYIYAEFDPTYDESGNIPSDASKLMGGNRHGTASDQRVTLDLADDYYQIASESAYNYSKDETGKDNPTHRDVSKWHYFINDIYFAEYGSNEYAPYRVSINVKEKTDGHFVYSFSAEKIRGQDAPQTLHAAVNNGGNPNANDLSSDPIKPQNGDGVNSQYTQGGEKYSFAPTMNAETLLERYENGEISREEYLERLNSRQHKGNPLTYAQLTPEDANTTPQLDLSIDYEGKSNRKGDGQSLFAESLQGAEIFDSRLKELAATDNAISRYDRIADMELMEEANRTINEGGAEFVTEWFSKKFDKSFTPKDVAIGYILMSRYQAVGDYYHAVKAAEKLREIATRSGQTVQMFAVLNRLTPEGMLLYAQRELDAAFEVIAKKRTRRWMLENEHLFKLTDAEQEFILNCVWDAAQLPDGRDKDIALAHISGLIQSKIPHENGQAFKALQRMSMLLNPKTNLRNIFGNVTITPQQIVSDIIGAGIDKATAAAFKTGVRVKTLPQVSAVKGWWKGVRESFDDFRRSAKAGYKIDTRKTGMDRLDIQGVASNNFNEHHTGKWAWLNPISKKLNAVDRFCSFLLDLGDRPFFEMWFMNSIEGQKKANHVTEATPEMIEIATLEGMQRTWQDENLMTKLVGTIKGAGNKAVNIHGYGLGDVAIKFSKTPANLAKAMIEFSPAGIAKALAVDFAKFKNALDKGEATASMQHHFVKTLSNGITGTLTMMAFATLISRGIIKATGKQDDDRDVADFERYVMGIQPYSIQVGGKSYSYDWAQPTAAQLAIVADYLQNKESAELAGEELDLFNSITSALTTAGSALYDQSFMQSIRTIMEEDDGFTAFYKAILSDISANIPMLSSQFASTFDDTVRTTYEYGDEWQTAVNKVKYKIPGARNTLAPAVDVMGNEKKQINDIWHSFFSPANVAEGYESKAADEVYRLYQETGEASVIPSLAPNYVSKNGGKYTLSSHEKAEYQTITGSIATEAVEALTESEGYRAISNDLQLEVLTDIYSYAKQTANKNVLGLELDERSAKAQSFIDKGIPAWQYFLLKKTASTDGNDSVNQDEAKAVLDASTLTDSQKEIMWMAFSPTGKTAWKYNPYKKRYY